MTFFGPLMSVSVRFGMGATIRSRQEIECLLYAGFFFLMVLHDITLTPMIDSDGYLLYIHV